MIWKQIISWKKWTTKDLEKMDMKWFETTENLLQILPKYLIFSHKNINIKIYIEYQLPPGGSVMMLKKHTGKHTGKHQFMNTPACTC